MKWIRCSTLTLLIGMTLTLSSASSTPSAPKQSPSAPKVVEKSQLLGDTLELDRNCVDVTLSPEFKITITMGADGQPDFGNPIIHAGKTGLKLNLDKPGCEPKVVRGSQS